MRRREALRWADPPRETGRATPAREPPEPPDLIEATAALGSDVEGLLGPLRERSANPPKAAVVVEGQCSFVRLEQIGQDVLEEREGAGPAEHVGDQGADERGLDGRPHSLGRLLGGILQFVGQHGTHVRDAVAECRGERGMLERALVEVGSQGEYHTHLGMGVGDRLINQIHEVARLGRVSSEGEKLFELVDDHKQFYGGIFWQDAAHCPQQAAFAFL